jgi:hypothetical protein
MAAASPIQTAFNAGELSPLIAGRVDYQKYVNGCKTLQNFIPTVQGPAKFRPGFHFVAPVQNSANRTWLVPFVFSETVAFVLEFGNGYIAFYTNHGQLLSGGVPYTISSPYTTADLINPDSTFALSFAQSADVIYIANPNHPPQKLIRIANTNWTINPVAFTAGPFQPIQVQTGSPVQVTSSAATGATTLTATSPIFSASDVGTLFYFQYPYNPPSPLVSWQSGLSVSLNQFIWSGNNAYQALNAGTTGSVQPIHTVGTKSDGAVNWQYLTSGYCYMQITAYTSPTQVSATIIGTALPTSGTASTTTLWAKSQWSGSNGYPSVVTFFRNRLVWAQNTQLFLSVAADYENMATEDAGVVSNDMAITLNIASDRYDQIVWLAATDVLLVGTVGSEYAVAEANTSQALGSSNIQAKQQTGNGGRAVAPVIFNSSTLFVQRAGRQLREIRYSFATNNYQSIDLTVLSEHIAKGQIVDMDFQQQPNYNVWCALNNGKLAALTYCREQDTVGWHEHVLGGGALVESVACIPRPDGTGDELWIIANITINGTVQRYVCYLDAGWDGDLQAISQAFYVDLGASVSGVNTTSTTVTITESTSPSTWNFPDVVTITASASAFSAANVGGFINVWDANNNQVQIKLTGYTSSTVMTGVLQNTVPLDLRVTPVSTWAIAYTQISGLAYLAGQTVTILGDGAPQPPQVVSNAGTISLQYPASVVQVGLPYTGTLTTMRFSGGGQTGPGQGMLKRITHVVFRLYQTLGGQYGNDGGPYDWIQWRASFDDMSQPPPMFTGDIKVEWNNGTDFDGYVSIQQAQPLPMTVIAVMPQFFTNDPQV